MLDPIVNFFTWIFQMIGKAIGLVIGVILWPFLWFGRCVTSRAAGSWSWSSAPRSSC